MKSRPTLRSSSCSLFTIVLLVLALKEGKIGHSDTKGTILILLIGFSFLARCFLLNGNACDSGLCSFKISSIIHFCDQDNERLRVNKVNVSIDYVFP